MYVHNIAVRWQNGEVEGFTGFAFSDPVTAMRAAENQAYFKAKAIGRSYAMLRGFAGLSPAEIAQIKHDWSHAERGQK